MKKTFTRFRYNGINYEMPFKITFEVPDCYTMPADGKDNISIDSLASTGILAQVMLAVSTYYNWTPSEVKDYVPDKTRRTYKVEIVRAKEEGELDEVICRSEMEEDSDVKESDETT